MEYKSNKRKKVAHAHTEIGHNRDSIWVIIDFAKPDENFPKKNK